MPKYFTLEDAISYGILTPSQARAAVDWIAANHDKDKFAASLRDWAATHGSGLSERQWRAAYDASQGKRPQRRRKAKISADVDPFAASSADKSGADHALATMAARAAATAVSTTQNKRIPLGNLPRQIARKAIKAAPGWKDYSDAKGVKLSDLSGDKLWDAADALNVDVSAALRADASGDADVAKPAASAAIDYVRVREIARDEVERRMKPVFRDRIVIDRDGVDKVTLDGVHHPKFADLLAATSPQCRDFSGERLNVALVGPTGTGKSYSVRKIAEARGQEYRFQSVALEPFDLVGYERVNGTMKVTPFVEAFRDGHICLVDEFDRMKAKALVALNSALANGEITLDDGTVIKRHPDFLCIAAGNTFGMGPTADFPTAERQDLSVLSRFAVRLDWHEDRSFELELAEKAHGDIGKAWALECQEARDAMKRLDLPRLADQRCIEAGAPLLAAGMTGDVVRNLTYLAPLDADQRSAVLSTMNATARV